MIRHRFRLRYFKALKTSKTGRILTRRMLDKMLITGHGLYTSRKLRMLTKGRQAATLQPISIFWMRMFL